MSFPDHAGTMVFIVTKDREHAPAFHGGRLGFAPSDEDGHASVFDLNGTMLRVSTVAGHVPADADGTGPGGRVHRGDGTGSGPPGDRVRGLRRLQAGHAADLGPAGRHVRGRVILTATY